MINVASVVAQLQPPSVVVYKKVLHNVGFINSWEIVSEHGEL